MRYSEQFIEQSSMLLLPFTKLFSVMQQSTHTAILDGSRNMKYRNRE